VGGKGKLFGLHQKGWKAELEKEVSHSQVVDAKKANGFQPEEKNRKIG